MDTQGENYAAELREDANQRAREWIAFLDSGEAGPEDRKRFEQWLALDSGHRAAYKQAQAIWSSAASLEALKQLEPLAQKKHSFFQGFGHWLADLHALPQWGAALASILLLVFVINSQQVEVPVADTYLTQTGEKKQLELRDGSIVSLGPQTAIEVHYTENSRKVSLLRGEAFFDVFHNPRKPFIVKSPYTQVTVLGTAFNVNSNRFGVTVAVQEGKVEVASIDVPGRMNSVKNLTAGQTVNVSETRGLGQLSKIEAEDASAWMQDLRIYVAQPLDEVLEDLSRYHEAELVIVDELLKRQPITAVFPTESTQEMLSALESVLPLTVHQVDEQLIELRAAP